MATQILRSYRDNKTDRNWYNSLYFSVLNNDAFIQQKSNFLMQMMQHLDITPEDKVVDLQAEIGAIANALQQSGYCVRGIEASAARRKYAKKQHTNVSFQSTKSKLAKQQYKFAYNLNNHFGQLHAEEEQINYLEKVANSLTADGFLLIDYFNIQTLLPTLPNQQFQRVQEVMFQSRSEQEAQFICEEVRVQDGHFQAAYTSKTHIHFRESFEYLFLRAGLRIARVYGDYEMQPFHAETSPRLILLVEKR
ncbi:MAG: hypothetical protein AB8G22_03135 [Saprospiraceae bacterium]